MRKKTPKFQSWSSRSHGPQETQHKPQELLELRGSRLTVLTLSANLERLFNKSKSDVKVETIFRDLPSLRNLGTLLSILREESHTYTVFPQNCWFFCSVIYENLFAMGGGVNTVGVPSEMAMSLAPKIRARINQRVKDFFLNSPPSRAKQSSDLKSREPLVRMDALPSVLIPGSSSWEALPTLVLSLPRADYAAHDSNREDVPLSCLQGTRIAILAQISSWLESVNGSVPSIYWLNGLAEIGKSTIAKIVAKQAADNGMLGGSFFFSRSDRPLRDPSLVFPTLAFQLAQSDDTFKNVIGDALKHDVTIGHKQLLQQLEGLILNPLLKIDRNRRTTLIVLDALDECEESGAAEILRLLFSHATRIPFLRILITSRPEPHIFSVFDKALNHTKAVAHDIEPSVAQEDIRNYLHDELTKITQRLNAADWVTPKEVDSLIERSGKLFIYAATCIRFINDNRVRDPHRHLRIILGTQTTQETRAAQYKQLDNLYIEILCNSLSDSDSDPEVLVERFQVVVGSMVLLRQPLPLNSLARFVRYQTNIVHTTLYHLGSVILMPPNIHEAPRLYHSSFVDFITNASRCTMPNFVIAVPKQERRHALRCFELMATFLKRDMAGISDPSIPNSKVNGFEDKVRNALPAEAQYACRCWAAHVSHVDHGDVAVMQALEKFSMESILWWFEAMSLIGSITTVAGSIEEVCKWAMNSRCTATVMTILSDAHRFILSRGEIIGASALHVYHLAIPFTPHDTTFYKAFHHERTGSITMLQDADSQWSLCLSTLCGHSDWVNCITFSPDGLRLASCSDDRTVRLWDAISGAQTATLEGHSGWVKSVVFSADGLRLASCSNDHTVRLWNAMSGAHIRTLVGHSDWVNSIAFSPDGLLLASCSDDCTVRLSNAISGAHIRTLVGHSGWVNSVAFSPDGLRLASCSNDRTVRLWDAMSGAHIVTSEGHSGRVRSLAFSPNGLRLASCSDDRTVRLWDAMSGAHISTLEGHSDCIKSVAFSPDGLRLASCSDDRTARLWEPTSGAHIGLEGHFNEVNSLAFSPDGLRLASCSHDHTLRLWDAVSGVHIATLKGHSGWVMSLAFSPDGLRLASCSNDRTVRLWDATSGTHITTLESHSDWVKPVAVSPGELRLASAKEDEGIEIESRSQSPAPYISGLPIVEHTPQSSEETTTASGTPSPATISLSDNTHVVQHNKPSWHEGRSEDPSAIIPPEIKPSIVISMSTQDGSGEFPGDPEAPSPIPPQVRATARQWFETLNRRDGDFGFITERTMIPFMLETGLKGSVLNKIWRLADIDENGLITLDGFTVALHLMYEVHAGRSPLGRLPRGLMLLKLDRADEQDEGTHDLDDGDSEGGDIYDPDNVFSGRWDPSSKSALPASIRRAVAASFPTTTTSSTHKSSDYSRDDDIHDVSNTPSARRDSSSGSKKSLPASGRHPFIASVRSTSHPSTKPDDIYLDDAIQDPVNAFGGRWDSTLSPQSSGRATSVPSARRSLGAPSASSKFKRGSDARTRSSRHHKGGDVPNSFQTKNTPFVRDSMVPDVRKMQFSI